MSIPRRLGTRVLEKPWGSPMTEPWLENPARRGVGEVWFTPPSGAPILVKLIFTTGRLSIQVHPDDSYARAHHESNGKTEMWHILRAEPDAVIGLNLKSGVTPAELRTAVGTERLESMLRWVPAKAGDTFYVEAGTIHAIGGGLVLCEVQQVSDITYRLWDYGSGRELHVADGLAVANAGLGSGQRWPRLLGFGRQLLAECAYFRTERIVVSGTGRIPARDRTAICVVLEGTGTLAGEAFGPGDGWELPASETEWPVSSANCTFLATCLP